jgi:RNA polymerase sigma-70 factor (ECF subfamily)
VKVLSDETVIARVLAGEVELFEILIRRYNQRLYRTAMAIIHDAEEAQEALQEVYLNAFEHLAQFAGKAQFSTWLTRIAVNESLARLAKRQRVAEVDLSQWEERVELAAPQSGPEDRLVNQSMRTLLETVIGRLAPTYRSVFVLREIERMSTAETALSLDISEPAVKVRLHRARAFLRKEIHARAGITGSTLYEFMGDRCDLIVVHVMARIRRIA